MRYLRRTLALLGWMSPLVGCINVSPAGTVFTSEPPGARVLVDGRDSGWVTPCEIALDEDDTHRVTISLAGYGSRELELEPDTDRSVVSWAHAVTGMKNLIHFPLLLPYPDLLFPLRPSHALEPGHVFVRLRPESAP